MYMYHTPTWYSMHRKGLYGLTGPEVSNHSWSSRCLKQFVFEITISEHHTSTKDSFSPTFSGPAKWTKQVTGKQISFEHELCQKRSANFATTTTTTTNVLPSPSPSPPPAGQTNDTGKAKGAFRSRLLPARSPA